MTALLPLLMVVIIFVCMATLYSEGMWSNAIRLINAVTAALVATNYFEPLARWLDNKLSAGTYAWDFSALWILFAVVFGILRSATDAISRIRVRFPLLADQIGGGFFALDQLGRDLLHDDVAAHRSPLPQLPLWRVPAGAADARVRADRQWLGFMQKVSLGAFRRRATAEEQQNHTYVSDPDADSKYAVFDESGAFRWKYATRRDNFANDLAHNGTILVSPKAGAPPRAPNETRAALRT